MSLCSKDVHVLEIHDNAIQQADMVFYKDPKKKRSKKKKSSKQKGLDLSKLKDQSQSILSLEIRTSSALLSRTLYRL